MQWFNQSLILELPDEIWPSVVCWPDTQAGKGCSRQQSNIWRTSGCLFLRNSTQPAGASILDYISYSCKGWLLRSYCLSPIHFCDISCDSSRIWAEKCLSKVDQEDVYWRRREDRASFSTSRTWTTGKGSDKRKLTTLSCAETMFWAAGCLGFHPHNC